MARQKGEQVVAYIEIDVQAELEPYLDRFDNAVYRGDKMQCCSPFREDRKPSFAINLVDGTWVDSGAGFNGEYKGNFVKLLALLQEVTYEEVLQDIKDRYGLTYADVEVLELGLKLENPFETVRTVRAVPKCEPVFSSYLEGRGIPTEVQKRFGTTVKEGAVGFPIKNLDGQIVNVKYRKLGSKKFWYAVDQPIKDYLYGFYECKQDLADTVFVVEGEIDCLYLWSVGVPAVATFGASVTAKQLRMLKQFRAVVLATDNDEVGVKFGNQLAKALNVDVQLGILPIPRQYKDVNEMPDYKLKSLCRAVKWLQPTFKFEL